MGIVLVYVDKEFEDEFDNILRRSGFFVSWFKNMKIPEYEEARKEKIDMAIKFYPADFRECDERHKDFVIYALWVW